jgi:hypothetical protein
MYRKRSSEPRQMYAKFAGKCACCGAPIKAGEFITYYPSRREIAHVGGLDGNSATCAANIWRVPRPRRTRRRPLERDASVIT